VLLFAAPFLFVCCNESRAGFDPLFPHRVLFHCFCSKPEIIDKFLFIRITSFLIRNTKKGIKSASTAKTRMNIAITKPQNVPNISILFYLPRQLFVLITQKFEKVHR